MKRKMGFLATTLLLVFTTAFCITGTVQSQSNDRARMEESFYRELEQDYVEEIRAYLTDEGFLNCGVMLTRTVYEDGSREYKLVVHNSRFAGLSDTETVALISGLQAKAFVQDRCSFICVVEGNA